MRKRAGAMGSTIASTKQITPQKKKKEGEKRERLTNQNRAHNVMKIVIKKGEN